MIQTLYSMFHDSFRFSDEECLLLWLCPILSSLGSLVYLALAGQGSHSHRSLFRVSLHVVARMFAGAVVGFIVPLYFVGALKDSPTTIARILALSVAVGFSAPRLWHLQQQLIENIVEQKIDDHFQAHHASHRSKTSRPSAGPESELDAGSQPSVAFDAEHP